MSWRMRVLQSVAWCLGLRFTPATVVPPSLPMWTDAEVQDLVDSILGSMDEDERPTVH
jgi:hypothetical protein